MINKSYTAHETSVLNVFQRHVAAFTSGDLDAVMSDFGPQSVVVTPDGVFEGLDRIRIVYRDLLAEFGNIERGDSPGLRVDVMHVCHDMLFITWNAETRNYVFPFGTDTFVCDGKRFTRQTISFSPPQPRRAPSVVASDSGIEA